MLTAPSFQKAIRALKTTIKGRALTSREMRKEANLLERIPKHEMHLRMRNYGAYTRYYLLAYAMIRGRAYHTVEQCRPGNEPYTPDILSALEHGTGLGLWDDQEIRAWVKVKPVKVEPRVAPPTTELQATM